MENPREVRIIFENVWHIVISSITVNTNLWVGNMGYDYAHVDNPSWSALEAPTDIIRGNFDTLKECRSKNG